MLCIINMFMSVVCDMIRSYQLILLALINVVTLNCNNLVYEYEKINLPLASNFIVLRFGVTCPPESND